VSNSSVGAGREGRRQADQEAGRLAHSLEFPFIVVAGFRSRPHSASWRAEARHPVITGFSATLYRLRLLDRAPSRVIAAGKLMFRRKIQHA
jgi:hypothetical protein